MWHVEVVMSGLLDAISNAVTGFISNAIISEAEKDIKKATGRDIKIKTENVPSEWEHWVAYTGVNSIANEDTWAFLENNEYNKRKVELWNERAIDTIILTVDTNPAEEDAWITCEPEWESGSKTLKLWFNMPRAGNWSSDVSWADESGYWKWWNLADEIVFGLQLYQLPGKCFYKSDWLEDFEDVDEASPLPFGTKKVPRWFQFRHWLIYWYPEAQWGWNWAYTPTPPKLPDGSLFSLDAVLSCPSLPNFKMPQIKLPSLPNVSLPSAPSISAPSLPSISAPSLSMPSLSAPSLGSLPSMPDKKKRPKGKWACHGYIELEGLKIKASGKDVIFSNATITHFWEDKDGCIDTEEKERQRLVLKATSEEQAESWKLSLLESGVEEGDAGGCCTVA